MAVARSPRYPNINLEDAINLAKQLYQKEGRSPVPPEIAVKIMGYKSVNGSSQRKLSALKQFGLISSEKDSDTIQITELGLRIVAFKGSNIEILPDLKRAAFNPKIFETIHKKYRECSRDSLSYQLETKERFSPTAARKMSQIYSDTVVFLDTIGGTSTDTQETISPFSVQDDGQQDFDTQLAVPEKASTDKEYIETIRAVLGDGIVANITFEGGPLTPEHFDLLIEYVKLAKRAFSSGATSQ